MAGYRPFGDRMLLKAEAEYRVRCGQSRADVSRELGVPLPTLAQWACQDGWRKKDLEAERGGDATRRLADRIIKLRETEKLAADERAAALKTIGEEMGWAKMGVKALVAEESWVRRLAVVNEELDARAARALERPEVWGREEGDGARVARPPSVAPDQVRDDTSPPNGPHEWGEDSRSEGKSSTAERGRWPGGPEGASVGREEREDGFMTQTPEIIAPEIISRWHEVALNRMADHIAPLLAEDVVFESPVVHTPQRGKAITEKYLRGALAVLNGPAFAYRDEWFKDRSAVLEFTTEIDGITINGVDIIHWNDEGKITEFRVMLRPLKAIQTVHAAMGAYLAKAG